MGRAQGADPTKYVQSPGTIFSGPGFNDYFSLDLYDYLSAGYLPIYDEVTVWGTTFISLGRLDPAQAKFFADNTVSDADIPFQNFPGAFVNVGFSKAGNLAAAQSLLTVVENNGTLDIKSADFTFNFDYFTNIDVEENQTSVTITQNESSTREFTFQNKDTFSDLCTIIAKSSGSNFDVLAGSGGFTIIGSNAVDKLEIDLAGSRRVTFDAQTGHYQAAGIRFSGVDTFHLKGGDFADTLSGAGGDDRFFGGLGNDRLFGREGNDNLLGGLGQDAEFGDEGDDLFRAGGDGGHDFFDGGDGLDTADFTRAKAGVRVDLAAGAARGIAANDLSQTGRDILWSIEKVSGSVLRDILIGDDAANQLLGNGGDDTMSGGAGNDLLAGGRGKDRLSGGAGDDVFQFRATAESTITAPDRITDFLGGTAAGGDRIDLSAIDAVPGGGDTAFAFSGTTARAYGIWFKQDAAAKVTHVFGDTDGNSATAELAIDVTGLITFSAFHFML